MSRPCEENKQCCYEHFDYGDNQTVCGIDYDGDNCPWIKPWGRKKYNERHHKKDGDGEISEKCRKENRKRYEYSQHEMTRSIFVDRPNVHVAIGLMPSEFTSDDDD